MPHQKRERSPEPIASRLASPEPPGSRAGSPEPPGSRAGSREPAGSRAARAGRVLIVEDDPTLLRALRINLRAHGYDVATAMAGQEALAEAARRPPDAVLLDLGLPDLEGNEVIRKLRARSRVPVIVLSGRAGSGDKIGALDAGADDYVVKPFNMQELLARLRAALRRDDHLPHDTRFRIGRCEIDLIAYTVVRHAPGPPARAADAAGPAPEAAEAAGTPAPPEAVPLTPTEWRLLEILLRAPGQLVSADRLLAEVWGPGHSGSTHYLRFHMARLRRKLEDDPPRPRHLLTEPGMGYRYQP
jgi:two-component system, OmpR family, KDP operon response regulator KdpE